MNGRGALCLNFSVCYNNFARIFQRVFSIWGPGRFMGSQFKGLRLTAGRRPKGKGRRSRFAYVGPMFAYVGLC